MDTVLLLLLLLLQLIAVVLWSDQVLSKSFFAALPTLVSTVGFDTRELRRLVVGAVVEEAASLPSCACGSTWLGCTFSRSAVRTYFCASDGSEEEATLRGLPGFLFTVCAAGATDFTADFVAADLEAALSSTAASSVSFHTARLGGFLLLFSLDCISQN